MTELDFTIEFNSDLENAEHEQELFLQADQRLREFASGHDDLTGASVTLRKPAEAETAPVYEATVVAYVRPNNIVGKEKQRSATGALKGALDAVERQVREKRARLRESWKQPEGQPVVQEVLEVTASEFSFESSKEIVEEQDE